jgi:SAM-dependent methyltransferase
MIKNLVRPYIRKVQQAYYDLRADSPWEAGIAHEVQFWDRYFKTKGLDWPKDYQERLNPNSPLSEYHRQFVDQLPTESVQILDVGAGPLTVIGKTHPTKQLNITATDALASYYDKLLTKYQVVPPVQTQLCKAENLMQRYEANSFDFVNAQNAVDHSEEPIRVIEDMIRLVKPGCYVALRHGENEAELEDYLGFHQWNFTIQDEAFVIFSKTETYNMSKRLAAIATVESHREEERVIVVSILKKATE